MRRLSFAPAKKDMSVTDVKKGHFRFVPRADRPARFEELRREVVNAGYDVEGTTIEVRGTLGDDGLVRAAGTAQAFTLDGAEAARLRREVPVGARIDVSGGWSADEKAQRIRVTSWTVVR